jgi:hypothetical protein
LDCFHCKCYRQKKGKKATTNLQAHCISDSVSDHSDDDASADVMVTWIPSLTDMILLVSNLKFTDTSTCETSKMHNGMMVAAMLKASPPNTQLTLLNAALSG